jgi:dTDP-4-dehydrorhamnose 3,5-epimerase
MTLHFEKTLIHGLFILNPTIFQDQRGYFVESYNKLKFSQLGLDLEFVQDNESQSQKNVLRGLHFQNPPHCQAKLIRVIKGSILDVAVDLRKSSPSYGLYYSIELNEQNKKMLFIPEGFAHGFVTLEENTICNYKCSRPYNPNSENSIRWNDTDINIDWGVQNPIVSDKDNNGILFKSFISPF